MDIVSDEVKKDEGVWDEGLLPVPRVLALPV